MVKKQCWIRKYTFQIENMFCLNRQNIYFNGQENAFSVLKYILGKCKFLKNIYEEILSLKIF